MATFDDLTQSLEKFSGRVRLFPLPNLVLFPHVMQPLRVFEPRYRELLENALADDRLIAMAMLTPGWEANYEGRPSLYSMACLGHITTYHRLADGTYNVLLLGVRRARLVREIKPLHRFREAMVELCDDQCPAAAAARQATLRQRLCEAVTPLLPSLPEVQEQVDQLLGDDVPLGVLTDVIGYMLDIRLAAKQRLLSELNVCRRAELLLAHLDQAGVEAADRPSAAFPPAFSEN
ncbi:MAG: LON peptidase substrate-binding domain-containing protein [Thermoguttaceae bacterium]